ncbi:hypothetical protein QE357_003529 [Siphonobacter sp. BAB-5404]|nr:hypothetical protein [Siphonobacter sp. SORGH_AS_0500]
MSVKAILRTRQFDNSIFLTLWLTLAAFGTYFCMFAFRKPFAAATFNGLQLWGIDYKIVLVVMQILGYATAKGIGIKFISEAQPKDRSKYILIVIGIAEVALLLFGIIPYPYNCFLLFINGLALGLVYGLVFGFLEGRRITDLLGAGICLSFIIASGVVKSIGLWFLDLGITSAWMPAVVGLLFTPLLILFVWMLHVSPPPTQEDERDRKPRRPMTAQDRRNFFISLAPGLILLILIYVLISMLRDIRDNFAVEIWQELGVLTPQILATTETWIGLLVTVLIGSVFLIKSNKAAFGMNLFIIAIGSLLIPIASWLFQSGQLSPVLWMLLIGLGIYLIYVPFNGILFERLIALREEKANVGFLFYTADFIGYIGSVSILLFKNFGHPDWSWLKFYVGFTYFIPLVCMFLLSTLSVYFFRKIH